MTQEQFIDYIESKAVERPEIDHDPENDKKAFHVIDDPYDLSEFDNALRNFATFPAMILEMGDGVLNDNGASSYNDSINSSFMIVDKREGDEPVRLTRSRCLEIAKKILYQIRKDCNSHSIVPGKYIHFRIDGIPYTPVGPMYNNHYGYMVSFTFTCPFSF